MAERLASEVNGRLYAAELLLAEWVRHSDASRALERAFCDSVVVQLAAAYRLYLREIAAACNYRGRCDSAALLRAGLAREGRDSAEVAVLQDAESTGGLAGLAAALQRASGDPSAAPAPQSSVADVLARDDGGHIGPQQCRDWLEALRGLIAAQRGQLQEW